METNPSIEGTEGVASPALLFDLERMRMNICEMIRLVGGETARLRPHLKTHKCAEILRLQLERGIRRVKCSTIAEAELAARTGCEEVLVAYPLVGPNVGRFRRLGDTFPGTRFATLVDSREGLEGFIRAGGGPYSLFLDLDCGMHRTGVAPGEQGLELVRLMITSPGLEFAGLHAYDGHIHDAEINARERSFTSAIEAVDGFLGMLEREGIEVPMIVSGGSPTFALHAAKAAQSGRPWQCSPGTTLLWDAGYGESYPEMPFQPAAYLLARVVSHPGKHLLCLDLGHKSVSAENPLSRRVRFPGIEGLEMLSQSEEHLVVSVPDPGFYPIGSEWIGLPYHVCPTVALHQEAMLVEGGKISGTVWKIGARNRRLSI